MFSIAVSEISSLVIGFASGSVRLYELVFCPCMRENRIKKIQRNMIFLWIGVFLYWDNISSYFIFSVLRHIPVCDREVISPRYSARGVSESGISRGARSLFSAQRQSEFAGLCGWPPNASRRVAKQCWVSRMVTRDILFRVHCDFTATAVRAFRRYLSVTVKSRRGNHRTRFAINRAVGRSNDVVGKVQSPFTATFDNHRNLYCTYIRPHHLYIGNNLILTCHIVEAPSADWLMKN